MAEGHISFMKNRRFKVIQRDSNLELLRLIAIMLIVMHHACISDSLEIFKTPFSQVNHGIVSALGIWGMFGVDLFFLISFWFMLDHAFTFRIDKWIKLIIEVVIFALISYAATIVIFKEPFSLEALAKTILSPAINTYWYITVYLIVFLLMPFFRALYEHLTDKAVMTLFALFFLAVAAYRGGGYSTAPISNLDYAFYMIIATMFVKRFEEKIRSYVLLGLTVSILACVAGTYAALYLGKGQGILYEICVNRFSPLQSLSAIFVFICFKTRASFKSKAINFLAQNILGVYILHASPFIAQHIWIDTFGIVDSFKSGIGFLIELISDSLIVVVACLLISIPVHMMISRLRIKGKMIDWSNDKLNFETKE